MVPSTMRLETSSRSAMAASAPGSRLPDMGQQAPDDFVRVDAVGFRLEVHQDAVAQHRQRHGANVLEVDYGPPLEQRASLAAEEKRLAGAWARAPAHPLADEIRRFLRRRTRGADETGGEIHDVVGGGHVTHQSVQALDLIAARHH